MTSGIKVNPDPNPIDVAPSAPTGGVGRRPSVTRASQDWMRENITVKTKRSHIAQVMGGS